MVNLEEASEIVMALCESVAKRMREQGLEGNVVELVIKTCDFNSYVRQRKIYNFTDITYEIYNEALRLLCDNWDRRIALRLLGVRVSGLRPASGIRQISFFDEDIIMKNQRLDRCMDKIRDKHGYNSILRAALMVNGSRDILEIEDPGDEGNITLNRGRMS
jgi:DNA polymerase-4